MVIIKQFKPAPGHGDRGGSKIRIPSRACCRCQSLHKKCDISSRGSTCSNCKRADVLCRGGGNQELRFRFSGLSQCPSTRPNPEQGSSSTTQATGQSTDISNPGQPPHGIASQSPEPLERVHMSEGSAPGLQSNSQYIGPAFSSPYQHNTQADDLTHHSNEIPLGDSYSLENDSTPVSEHASTKCKLRSPFPLTNKEAQLMKHFWAVLLPWFDYCDPRAHFRSYIQATMRSEACTLFAILAVSARHLEAIQKEYYNSNEYERECLGIMIPMLNDKYSMQKPDDSLLVSALLLRCLEEMTRTDDHHSAITHTVSASLLLRISRHNNNPSEFSNAALAVALRQEIYIANRVKRPIELEGRNCGIDESLTPAPDFIWTFRIMSHAARVTNYAYGVDARSQTLWDQLWVYLEHWDQSRPSSFNALNRVNLESSLDALSLKNYNRSTDGTRVFPEIYYVSDCPVAGNQYLQLCKILLLAHDPRVISLGLGRAKSIQVQEEKIRQAVRVVCGVSLSNPEHTAARILAGLVIGMAGELFQDASETGQLLEIVYKAEMHLGWPGIKVSPKLQELWGLEAVNARFQP
ncbi:hypothetical protein F5Y19DRAFT_444904 [Xylariaceae sp. FL1651]|nr:hypothetical protein F5Y19DRAFT_444904 [Xylariaceae sp. FL1651]